MKSQTLRWMSAALFLGGLAGCPLDREANIGSDGTSDGGANGNNSGDGRGDCLDNYCPPGDEGRPDAGAEPGPIDADPCVARCVTVGADAAAACIAGDGSPERCAAQGREAEGRCRQACGGAEPDPAPDPRPDPRPEPPECGDVCAERAQSAADRCIAEGGAPERCRNIHSEALAACSEICDAPPPEPVDRCADLCETRAREAGARCFEAGGNRERCMPIIDDERLSCLERCNPAEPPPPPAECPERCADVAAEVIDRCFQAGGDRARCAEAGNAAQAACRERCAGAEPEPAPQPHPCATRCADAAAAERDACLAEGNDPRRCDARARDLEAECRVRCLGEPEPQPEPPACVERCAQVGREVEGRCRAGDGSPERCAAQGREAEAACRNECAGVEPPAPEPAPTCADRCTVHLRDLVARCIESGGSAEDCRARAAAQHEACQRQCAEPQPDPRPEPEPIDPCDGRCAEQAGQSLRACLAAGGGPDRCETQARELFNRCQAACSGAVEPPPPVDACDARCGELADATRDRCVASGADRETCARAAAAAESDCHARCAGVEPQPEPEPDPRPEPEPEPVACQDRCASHADETHRACIERRNDAAACGELARQTYEQCTAANCGR